MDQLINARPFNRRLY